MAEAARHNDPPEPDPKTPDGAVDERSEPGRPFRLVKYFSLTGFLVILVFTLGLTIFISEQGKRLVLKKSEDYARLLADNLNHQVFLQFVVPTVLRNRNIRLREPDTYKLLDAVVRSTIHSFKVSKVNIYDVEGSLIYTTDKDKIGTKPISQSKYNVALKGKTSTVLKTKSDLGLAVFDRDWTLITFYPFRAEKPVRGAVGHVMGVFEITQDLTDEYANIANFQYISFAISIGFSGLLFFILRQILVRGEKIIDERNEERRRMQEELHQSQRLANLGRMVAAVAHEIRNPLGIISSTAEIMEKKIKTYEPDSTLSGIIVEESRRLDGIVTEFLDFARPQVPNLKACMIEAVIEENLAFLAAAIEKDKIHVVRDYQAADVIDGDPDLLYRVFMNVFVNAIQAMPDGGTLTIRTIPFSGSNGKEPSHVEVTVADSGVGIDPEKAENLFDPFYTTKNRGSGLGLAIVKNIIDGHKGSVFIEPGPTRGSRLTIRLPIRQI